MSEVTVLHELKVGRSHTCLGSLTIPHVPPMREACENLGEDFNIRQPCRVEGQEVWGVDLTISVEVRVLGRLDEPVVYDGIVTVWSLDKERLEFARRICDATLGK